LQFFIRLLKSSRSVFPLSFFFPPSYVSNLDVAGRLYSPGFPLQNLALPFRSFSPATCCRSLKAGFFLCNGFSFCDLPLVTPPFAKFFFSPDVFFIQCCSVLPCGLRPRYFGSLILLGKWLTSSPPTFPFFSAAALSFVHVDFDKWLLSLGLKVPLPPSQKTLPPGTPDPPLCVYPYRPPP